MANDLKKYQWDVLKIEYAIVVPLILILLPIKVEYAIGLLWGACFSIIVFNLKIKWINKFSEQPYSRGKAYFNYLIKYFILALAMYIAFKVERVDLYTALAGIFSTYFVIFCKAFYSFYRT